jgi:hypothetical protein
MTPKRPRDPNQLAKSIVDIATGEKPDFGAAVKSMRFSGLIRRPMRWRDRRQISGMAS